MPGEKALSTKQIEQYRNRLREMRDRMLGEVDSVVESIREEISPTGNLSGIPVHMADSAPDQLDADIDVVENERDMLEQIQAALHRIEAGTFGKCVDCGTAIPAGRLRVIPYTPYCVPCANKHAAEEATR